MADELQLVHPQVIGARLQGQPADIAPLSAIQAVVAAPAGVLPAAMRYGDRGPGPRAHHVEEVVVVLLKSYVKICKR